MDGQRHILFYDGVCGMCDRIVQFVLARDRRRVFAFAALQSEFAARTLAPFGKDPRDLDTVYVIADSDGPARRILDRGRAILFILREMGGGWGVLARIASILPTGLINVFYRLVARSRYRIFGKLDACRVPTSDERARFLES